MGVAAEYERRLMPGTTYTNPQKLYVPTSGVSPHPQRIRDFVRTGYGGGKGKKKKMVRKYNKKCKNKYTSSQRKRKKTMKKSRKSKKRIHRKTLRKRKN